MPANLPPNYFEAEKRLRRARVPQEKILILEEMMAIIPKHKGTEHLQGDIKRKIAKLKQDVQRRPMQGRRGPAYHVEKEGAAQVLLFGPPNSGKSQLLDSLTKAAPEVADYPCTTRNFLPGMMPYENIQIQLVDTPPLAMEHMRTWIFSLLRLADAIALVVDLGEDDLLEQVETLKQELEASSIFLVGDQREIESTPPKFQKRSLIVANKCDLEGAGEKFEILKELYGNSAPVVAVSAREKINFDGLKKTFFGILHILRVYSKSPGKTADMNNPVVMKEGSTVLDFSREIHKDFAKKFKYAKVWGRSTFEGQRVQRDYVLQDGDIIELHM